MTYEEAVEKFPIGSRYRHYKGNCYEIIAIGLNADTEPPEPMIVYRALYGKGLIWIKSVSEWIKPVEYNSITCEDKYTYKTMIERYARIKD